MRHEVPGLRGYQSVRAPVWWWWPLGQTGGHSGIVVQVCPDWEDRSGSDPSHWTQSSGWSVYRNPHAANKISMYNHHSYVKTNDKSKLRFIVVNQLK